MFYWIIRPMNHFCSSVRDPSVCVCTLIQTRLANSQLSLNRFYFPFVHGRKYIEVVHGCIIFEKSQKLEFKRISKKWGFWDIAILLMVICTDEFSAIHRLIFIFIYFPFTRGENIHYCCVWACYF